MNDPTFLEDEDLEELRHFQFSGTIWQPIGGSTRARQDLFMTLGFIEERDLPGHPHLLCITQAGLDYLYACERDEDMGYMPEWVYPADEETS